MIFDSNHSKLHVFMGFCRFSWGFHGVLPFFMGFSWGFLPFCPPSKSHRLPTPSIGTRRPRRRWPPPRAAPCGPWRPQSSPWRRRCGGIPSSPQTIWGGKVRAFRRKAGIILHHMNFYISIYDYMCDDSLLSWFSMFVIMDFFFGIECEVDGHISSIYIYIYTHDACTL